MKKSRFTDSQIAFILRQAEDGKSVCSHESNGMAEVFLNTFKRN